MVDQYHFETTVSRRRDSVDRVRARVASPWVRAEMRMQRELETHRTTAARVRNFIAELEHQAAHLDTATSAVLAGAKVRDPAAVAYPIEARALGARRDNVRSTIAALSGCLAKDDQGYRALKPRCASRRRSRCRLIERRVQALVSRIRSSRAASIWKRLKRYHRADIHPAVEEGAPIGGRENVRERRQLIAVRIVIGRPVPAIVMPIVPRLGRRGRRRDDRHRKQDQPCAFHIGSLGK